MTSRAIVVICALLVAACDHGSSATNSTSDSAPPATSASAAALPGGIHWIQGPAGVNDVSASVKAAADKERAEGRTLLVYVGAPWCEPCQRFHHAVDHGDLDTAFPHLSIIAFDADKDSEALANGGYFSRLIPLLALPGADGRASGKQMEGGIKGDGAVGDITPRLRTLLGNGS